MVRWIEDNNNIGNILKFSGYSRLFSSRDKTTEDDIVSIIGVKSETIDVFILSRSESLIIFPETHYLYRVMILGD